MIVGVCKRSNVNTAAAVAVLPEIDNRLDIDDFMLLLLYIKGAR